MIKRGAASIPVQDSIYEMVRRIAAQFHPDKIILFGSHARGKAGPDSDVDLMVEMESPLPRGARAAEILKAFGIRPWAMDLIVYTPQEVMASRGTPGSLLTLIEAEGRTLYEQH